MSVNLQITDRLAFLLAFLAAGITGLVPDRVFFSLLALFALQTIPAAVFWLRPLPRTWNICNKLSGISLLLGWLIRGAFGAVCYDLAILFALLHLLRDNLDLLR